MVRFGIVGGLGIAQKFARDIKFLDNAKITAVAARNKENANKYQDFYQVEYSYPSYEEMAKSKEIDAVYIAVPHNFHHDLAMLFMRNKKHVLVEKPIAVNQMELLEMIDCARENQVLLMEGMWTNFLPSTTYVKKVIDSGILGQLQEAKISFGYSLIEDYPLNGRLTNINLAGGSLLDLGIYPISFYNFIKKEEIKTLRAQAKFLATEVDASVNVLITDKTEAKITLQSSLKETLDNNALLVFEKGIIKMLDFSRSEKIYINETEVQISYEGEGFVHEIRSFVETILNEETENKIMTYEKSMESIKLMDEIRKTINLKFPFECNKGD